MLLLSISLAVAAGAECPTYVTLYRDGDGDGFGVTAASREACARFGAYAGWSHWGGDCDDHDAGVNPGAAEVCNGVDDDCDGVIDPGVTCEPTPDYRIEWGDLHAHTGLSQDGCEEPTDQCLPTGDEPAAGLYAAAAANGLAFLAMTDHVEQAGYVNLVDGYTLDVWERTQFRAREALGTGIVPIVGYEYTGSFGHRSVVFDTTTVCRDFLVAASVSESSKQALGLESYIDRPASGFGDASEVEAALAAASIVPGCSGTRWLSWFHHPAYRYPGTVNWDLAGNLTPDDRVIEIISEHGSSECANLTRAGCEFRSDSPHYREGSSVQAALQLGLKLGFVGGSDNHQGTGAVLGDGPGFIGVLIDADGDGVLDTPRQQNTDGGVTGVLVPPGHLTRAGIFDAIDARHTVASTWMFEGLQVYAYDASGTVYLPGDDIPASAGLLTLHVSLDDPTVDEWSYEVVNPYTGIASTRTTITVRAGDAPYIRIRAWVDGEEQRIWASPFFG